MTIDEEVLADFAKVATAAYCVSRANVWLARNVETSPDHDTVISVMAELSTAQELLDTQVRVLKERLGITPPKTPRAV
jgi:hypothetical protein